MAASIRALRGGFSRNRIKYMRMFRFLFCLLIAVSILPLYRAGAESLYSPSWGFRMDLPEEFDFIGGDGKNQFSFASDAGVSFTVTVYPKGAHNSIQRLARDIKSKLKSGGEVDYFEYNKKKAALIELNMTVSGEKVSGWGFCVSLGEEERNSPFLAALAYGPGGEASLTSLYFSCLDSIIPTDADRRFPGPMAVYAYPPDKKVQKTIAGTKSQAIVGSLDEEAAQATVDREFSVLRRYANSPKWKEAWIRFYRAIFRDSYERLADIAFAFERDWYNETRRNASSARSCAGNDGGPGQEEDNAWEFAQYALSWVQGFAYERDFLGSDFVNVVSAALQGRGDCDSRSMLWAIMLERNNIAASMMVSRDYSHAMGLVLLEGPGASFKMGEYKWIVAETTAKVDLGLIGENVSDPALWLGIPFD